MGSPFFGFDNSTLSFQVPDSYSTNELGNQVALTKTVEIKAILKVTTSQTILSSYADQIQQFAGADGYATLLEGYLVEPRTYPEGIDFLAEGDLKIVSSLGKEEKGRFKLLPIIQSPYVVLAKIDLVTPIIGVFRKN